jgi:uncharacterized membrane protein
MAKARPTPQPKWPYPLRIILSRPRLFLSILTGVLVGVLLPFYVHELRGVTRLLVGWDVGVALYLVLAFWMIAHSSAGQTHSRSFQQDEGGFAILVGTIVAATASVGAVFSWLEAATRAETFAPGGLVFLLVTILLSWTFIHTMFALHYAHEFYSVHSKKGGGGLNFPHCPQPDYWDFVYLAFSIGTSFEVSDVAITSKRIRRTVMVHGIVSFFFNVTLIALTVGLVGDAVQN